MHVYGFPLQLYDWPLPYDGDIGFVMYRTSDAQFNIPEGMQGGGDGEQREGKVEGMEGVRRERDATTELKF